MSEGKTPKEIKWEALIRGQWRPVSRDYLLFHVIGTKELQAYRKIKDNDEPERESETVNEHSRR